MCMKQPHWRGQGMCTGRWGDTSNFGNKWVKETVKKHYILADKVFPMRAIPILPYIYAEIEQISKCMVNGGSQVLTVEVVIYR